MVSQHPRQQYMVLQWGQVDLQEYANGSFVSNNNIFTIPFLKTYYHKQMNKILIAAYNEAFRQSSDPVYAHTPMRNVGELRTFNPKLKDSAGGEVNKLVAMKLSRNNCLKCQYHLFFNFCLEKNFYFAKLYPLNNIQICHVCQLGCGKSHDN